MAKRTLRKSTVQKKKKVTGDFSKKGLSFFSNKRSK